MANYISMSSNTPAKHLRHFRRVHPFPDSEFQPNILLTASFDSTKLFPEHAQLLKASHDIILSYQTCYLTNKMAGQKRFLILVVCGGS